MREQLVCRVVIGVAFVGVMLCPRPAAAYSVLAHEATVDAAWDDRIVPLLRQRFRGITPAQIADARAYAYGGSLIQDLGYYPFGSHLFTNLTHYVRSGDFVEALIRGAQDANEYAFALGALAHYASDNAGHPIAVNRVVPLIYPKIRTKIGKEALYADSPKRHVMVEFAFDVSQVAQGAYVAQEYHDRIGFEVSKRLLESAVHETYAVELKDLLLDVDLAIGTYRHAVGTTIPEMTRIAWREKRDEIVKRTPGVDASAFVFNFSGREYDREFGTKYRKPGPLARVMAFVLKILPKVGPFQALAFTPLTPEAERLFLESVTATRARYRTALEAIRVGRLNLANTDFDTGQRSVRGRNPLAEETYADFLNKLAGRKFVDVSPQLRSDINNYFRDAVAPTSAARQIPKNEARIRLQLAALNASSTVRQAGPTRTSVGF